MQGKYPRGSLYRWLVIRARVFFLSHNPPPQAYYEGLCMRGVNQSIGRAIRAQGAPPPEAQLCRRNERVTPPSPKGGLNSASSSFIFFQT